MRLQRLQSLCYRGVAVVVIAEAGSLNWDEDEVNHTPVRNPDTTESLARMDVDLSMLVRLKEWSVPQGILVLLSALAAVLNRVAEYVVPTEREFGAGRPAFVAASSPLRSIGARLGRIYPVPRPAGGARMEAGAFHSSNNTFIFRSRSLG
jgi:hypothetical protein